MDDAMFKIIEAIVTIVVIVLCRYTVPYLKSLVSAEQLSTVANYATFAVLTAEQILSDVSGQQKKSYVVNLIENFCEQHKMSITEEQINTLIESAVKEMNDANK